MKSVIIVLLTGLMLFTGFGCVLQGDKSAETAGVPESELAVESFRGTRTITVRWPGNVNAEEYILMRARDEVDGIGSFEQIYRGKGTTYIDRDVQDDIRYVYRLDIFQKGKIYEGEQTGIGVGSSAEVDMNEPNNRKEDAATLNAFKRATMYYFRFSDGRELSDTDWYKIKINGNSIAYLQIKETGTAGITTLLMRFEGQEAFPVEQGKWYELRNEASIERELYIEILSDNESYVEKGLAGGTIRGYTITRSDIKENDDDDPGLPSEGDGGNGEGNTNGEDPENPGESVIEERSDLFVADGTGRFVFLLNDKKYLGRSYTFWKYLEKEWTTDTEMTMELVKESGNFLGGYGYFFAGENIDGYGECMLVILVQKDGNYAIGKAIQGQYQDIKTWRSSNYFRKGYGVKNTVGVRRDNNSQEYVLTINGVEETRFVDVNAPVCTGKRTGMVAVVTSIEQFPQTPVKVGYR